MRKAIVRSTNGLVVNVIEIEEGANWQPPKNCYLIDTKDGSPGDTWDGEKFVRPMLPEPTPDEIRVSELLSHSPDVITQAEMWELMRIFGKKLGYKFDEDEN